MKKWFVYRENINTREIGKYDVLSHGGFREAVAVLLVTTKTKEEFSKKLDQEARYYFWSRCEHEIILSSWPPSDRCEDVKIDVYDQLSLNWDAFVNSLWEGSDLNAAIRK